MGTGCCSGGGCDEQATAATRCDGPSAGTATTTEAPAVADVDTGDGCLDDDDCCDEKTCCDGDGGSSCADLTSLEKVECCNSNEEHCDGESRTPCLISPRVTCLT